jgi:hypothetical protein
MRTTDVQINHQYTAKISGQLAIVEILAVCKDGGWKARDQVTDTIVHIQSVRQLRYAIHNPPYKLTF